MKIIDNNGRLFGKISVIDVFVIVIVAIMAGALYLKTNTMTHTSTAVANDKITFQVYVRAADAYLEDDLRVGDTVFDEERPNSGCLGVIKAIEGMPGSEFAGFLDGSVELVLVEDAVDLLLTIEGEGLISDKSYALNRIYDLGVNSARNFCTQYARFTGTVVSITG